MFCSKCGSELPESAQFCPKCGAETGKQDKDKGETATVGENKKKVLIAGVAVALLLFAIVVYGFLHMVRVSNLKPADYDDNIAFAAEITDASAAEVTGDSVTESTDDSQTEDADKLSFKYYSDGTASVTGIIDGVEIILIPSEVSYEGKTYPVTSIGENAFCGSSLTSVRIPDSVTSIGYGAFSNCDSLTSVKIPDSVMWIGVSAFAHCDRLTSVEISDNLTEISDVTFSHCRSLTSVEIPDSVTSIGAYAFSECSSLTRVEMSSETEVRDNTFSNCPNLNSIIRR